MPFSPKLPVPSSTRPWGLSKEHRISLNGLDFIPDLSGALFVPDAGKLVRLAKVFVRLIGTGG